MRTSIIRHLNDETLVVVRRSMLVICDGNHCAAALLNNFEYWHNWLLDCHRQDQINAQIDPSFRPSGRDGSWIWKTADDLAEDLLHNWGTKSIRAAITFLELKGFIESRKNPKDPLDHRRQFQFCPSAVQAAIDVYAERRNTDSAKTPHRSGKNAGSAESTTCGDSPPQKPPQPRSGKTAESDGQKCRVDPAKLPLLLTEITNSEITSSSPYDGRSDLTTTRKTGPPARSKQMGSESQSPGDPIAQTVLMYLSTLQVEKLRRDGAVGPPETEILADWSATIRSRGLGNPGDIVTLIRLALRSADRNCPEGWNTWTYLTRQVRLAAQRLPKMGSAQAPSTSDSTPLHSCPEAPADHHQDTTALEHLHAQQLRANESALEALLRERTSLGRTDPSSPRHSDLTKRIESLRLRIQIQRNDLLSVGLSSGPKT